MLFFLIPAIILIVAAVVIGLMAGRGSSAARNTGLDTQRDIRAR